MHDWGPSRVCFAVSPHLFYTTGTNGDMRGTSKRVSSFKFLSLFLFLFVVVVCFFFAGGYSRVPNFSTWVFSFSPSGVSSLMMVLWYGHYAQRSAILRTLPHSYRCRRLHYQLHFFSRLLSFFFFLFLAVGCDAARNSGVQTELRCWRSCPPTLSEGCGAWCGVGCLPILPWWWKIRKPNKKKEVVLVHICFSTYAVCVCIEGPFIFLRFEIFVFCPSPCCLLGGCNSGFPQSEKKEPR